MNVDVNGYAIFVDEVGAGDPVVCVHGSWTSGATWNAAAQLLSDRYRVISYDRRGHSRSQRDVPAHTIHDDAADLALIIEQVAGGSARVLCNSYGGVVAFRLAVTRPELFRGIASHEPPAFGVLEGGPHEDVYQEVVNETTGVRGLLDQQRWEDAARAFVEDLAFGRGAWETLPPPVREMFVTNAPTFREELNDPDALAADLERLNTFGKPVLLTQGTQSPPRFGYVMDLLASVLPNVRREMIAGAGHAPNSSHPKDYVAVVRPFLDEL
jgi:pimeloyl-ACP methyl ester carboxylesterase